MALRWSDKMRNNQQHATRVLIVTQYSLPDDKRNMNAYQRIFYGARHVDVTLLIRRQAEVSAELTELVRVARAPIQNRVLFFAYSVMFALAQRCFGCRTVLTEPSGFAAVGFLARIFGGYFWVLDVWDRPRWRPGTHETDGKPSLSDQLVFWMMRHADLYLLSVLPCAAKDINPAPSRCVQFYNAIDQSLVAASPLSRPDDRGPTLHLAYGRSKFWDTMGLDVVIQAAEKLKASGCPVTIHLVGQLPDEERERIERSEAADYFRVHGFIEKTRTEFFRTMHAGLVPYVDYEDLSYIFPIKVLEHLSQGNPVIATRLPGLCAMVTHEENGLLVKPGDGDELAAAIERLQRDAELFNRLSRNALASIKKFDTAVKNRKIFEAIFHAASLKS
jgi:hypothetical protein